MQAIKTWAGIDVSAQTLVACRGRDNSSESEESFSNDHAGHQKLIQWLGKKARVCLEATGVYHLQLALALEQAGVEVMVVNPRVAKDFSRALSHRSKSDQVDARVLLEYALRMAFHKWNAPRAAILQLRELGRRLSELVGLAAEEKNRQHAQRASAVSATVLLDIQQHVEQLDKRIEQIERAAVEVICADADLRQQFDLIRKARGFGRRTAILLLAELAVLDPTMTARQLVAHAGLDPRVYESGTSVQRLVRISHVGNARIRAILYMNALTVIRSDRGARLFFAGLVVRGKKRMQAVVAVMRKLLHGIWTILQRRVPFDSSILFAASLAKAESSDSAVPAHQPEPSEDHPQGRSEAEELRQQLDPRSAEATPQRKSKAA